MDVAQVRRGGTRGSASPAPRTPARKTLLLSCLFVVTASCPHSQAQSAPDPANAVVVTAAADWGLEGEFDRSRLSSGYSLSGRMEVGVRAELAFSDMEPGSSHEILGSIYLSVTPLMQRSGVPFSLALSASYGFAFVDSDYLKNNDLMMRGRGFDIQATLLRRFRIGGPAVRTALVGSYRSYVYTLEEQSPQPTSTITTSRSENLEYGGLLGCETAGSSGFQTSLDAVVTLDEDFNIHLGVLVRLLLPATPY